MTFPTDDILLGAPNYGPRGNSLLKGQCDGIIWHTTEGAGTSRLAAVATARWQGTPGATTGSYNFIIYDGGLLLTVPYLEISGGVNPSSHAWAPQRFPWIKALLPARAYNDPNRWQMNVSFSGRTKEFAAGNMPANMIETAKKLVLWVQDQPWGADLLTHTGHMHWQTNRSDPSQRVLDDIKKVEESMAARMFVPQSWKTNKDARVHLSPSKDSDVIAIIPSGSSVASIEEEAELRGGIRVTIGSWRTVVLGDWRTGFVHRIDIDPIVSSEYTDFVRNVLFEVDLNAVPKWPLGLTAEAIRTAGITALEGIAVEAHTLSRTALAAKKLLEEQS